MESPTTPDKKPTRILAFDFDQCVADGDSLLYLYIDLMKLHREVNASPQAFSMSLRLTINRCVNYLAHFLLSRNLLYVFRPGMEKVFETVYTEQIERGIDHCIFYSNNSSYEFLDFMEKMIRLASPNLPEPIVKHIYTAHSPSRAKVETVSPGGSPNARPKTVQGILQCLADDGLTVKPEYEILFFDDMVHPGLSSNKSLLITVRAYQSQNNYSQVFPVFMSALYDGNLLNEQYVLREHAWQTELENAGINIPFLKYSYDDAYKYYLEFADNVFEFNDKIIQDSVISENAISGTMAAAITIFGKSGLTSVLKSFEGNKPSQNHVTINVLPNNGTRSNIRTPRNGHYRKKSNKNRAQMRGGGSAKKNTRRKYRK